MSAASRYGVAVVDLVIRPAFERAGLTMLNGDEDAETGAGDLLGDLLHWVEAQGGDINNVIGHGMRHWGDEHNAGDDLANDPFYDDLIERLEAHHAAL